MSQLLRKNNLIRLEMLWKFTMDMSYDFCSNINARMLVFRNSKCRSKNTLVSHLHITLVQVGMNGDGGQTVHKRLNAFIASLNPPLIITKRTAQEHSADSRAFMSFQLARVIIADCERETAVVIDIAVLPCVNYVCALTSYLREDPAMSYYYPLEEAGTRPVTRPLRRFYAPPRWERPILESYSM